MIEVDIGSYNGNEDLFDYKCPPEEIIKKQIECAFERGGYNGFKMFYSSLKGHSPDGRMHHGEYTRQLLRSNCRVIHLYRTNVLDRLLSFRLALGSKRWYYPINGPTDAPPDREQRAMQSYNQQKVQIPIRLLWKSIEMQKRDIRDIRRVFKSRLFEIEYTDIKNRATEILDWLGCAKHPIEVQSKRQRRRPKSEIIKNYSQVRQLLSGTRYEWMLDEDI